MCYRFMSPMKNAITAITMKMKNRIFAISAAPAAIPPNPSTAAMMAMTKKMTAYLSMGQAPVDVICYGLCDYGRRSTGCHPGETVLRSRRSGSERYSLVLDGLEYRGAQHQEQHEQNEEDEKQNLRNASGTGRDSGEPQHAGDHGNDGK